MTRLVDNLITLRILRLFTMKYKDTNAYKLGLINEKGQQLVPMKNFTRPDQYNSYTLLHRLVFRLRGLLEKVPFVKNRLANYAAALLLVREKIVSEEEFHESDDVLLEKIEQYKKRPGMYLAEKAVKRHLDDDAPANATGPAVAGTSGSGTVVVPPSAVKAYKKKNRKKGLFRVSPETFDKFSKGKRKFERWSNYLNLENEAERKIYDFARRHPDAMIVLQDTVTDRQKGIRFNSYGGGNWRNISRNPSLKEFIESE